MLRIPSNGDPGAVPLVGFWNGVFESTCTESADGFPITAVSSVRRSGIFASSLATLRVFLSEDVSARVEGLAWELVFWSASKNFIAVRGPSYFRLEPPPLGTWLPIQSEVAEPAILSTVKLLAGR